VCVCVHVCLCVCGLIIKIFIDMTKIFIDNEEAMRLGSRDRAHGCVYVCVSGKGVPKNKEGEKILMCAFVILCICVCVCVERERE